jgi:hypothetical protein
MLFFAFFLIATYSVFDQNKKRNIIENSNNIVFIDFSRKYQTPNEFPEYIQEITNISNHENWGRWAALNSDSNDIKIVFKKSLPINFKIEMQLIGFNQNIGRPVSLIVSGQKKILYPSDDTRKIYHISFEDIDPGTKTIIIRPFKYISPKELSQDSNDSRKISIGLITLGLSKTN